MALRVKKPPSVTWQSGSSSRDPHRGTTHSYSLTYTQHSVEHARAHTQTQMKNLKLGLCLRCGFCLLVCCCCTGDFSEVTGGTQLSLQTGKQREISLEKMIPSDWPAGKSEGAHSWLLGKVQPVWAGATPGQVVLDCIKELSQPLASQSSALLPGPCFRFCPITLKDGPFPPPLLLHQGVSQTNPFYPKLLLVKVFITH